MVVAPLQRWPFAVFTTIFSGASPALYQCRAAFPDELLYHRVCRDIRLAALVRDPDMRTFLGVALVLFSGVLTVLTGRKQEAAATPAQTS